LPRRAAIARLGRAAFLAALAAACARIVPPGGGPEDREPPRVIALAPDSGATAVARDAPLRLDFSEAMNRSSVRDWLQVSPDPGQLAMRWEAHALVCAPAAGWLPRTTYTVLLGTRATDPRSNRLAKALLFAFATGETLDVGDIPGTVRTRSLTAEGMAVFLFPWPAEARGTIDTAAVGALDPLRALRRTEAAKDGRFELRFAPRRTPLLVTALYDRNGDRAYDPEEDRWGFVPHPVVVGESTRTLPEVDVYVVYTDEPGDLVGSVADSACAGYTPPAHLRAVADSLGQILGGTRDAMGFLRSRSDTLPSAELSPVEADTLRAALTRLETRLQAALSESLRCTAPIWVTALKPDSTVAADARGTGPFELKGLAAGIYRLSAFRDLNADGVRQAGEPGGEFPHPVELLPGRRVEGIDWSVGAP
jgi:hypothetical protein